MGLCRSICHYEPAQAQILPGLRVQLGGGHTPSCCHPCQDITDREKVGCRSRANERKESREAAITSQVAVGLIARTLGLPNWGIEVVISGNWKSTFARRELILAKKIGVLYRPPVIITRRASPPTDCFRCRSPIPFRPTRPTGLRIPHRR